METKDRDNLRAAAEKATKGPWEYLSVKEAFVRPTINAIDRCYICYMLTGEFSNTDANGNFIALTDPDTILALLDALDEAEKNLSGAEDNAGELQQCFNELMPENTDLREALRRIEIYAENHMEGAGMPEFKQFKNIAVEAHEALIPARRKK